MDNGEAGLKVLVPLEELVSVTARVASVVFGFPY
jgi:hypothetical protein